MESTSCKENCPFVKQGFCSSCKECPNYIETWWLKGEGEQPVKLEDCSPKRMVLQQQLLQNRLEHVQIALEESRNQYHVLSIHLKSLIEMAKTVITNNNQIQENPNEQIQIEYSGSNPM